jgi:YidC/Oxa1 family membrane protein insertase
MDRVQIGAIGLAAALIVTWLLTLPRSPSGPLEPERGAGPQAERIEKLPAPGVHDAGVATVPEDDALRYEFVKGVVTVLENDAVRVGVSSIGGRFTTIRLKLYEDRVGGSAGAVELVTLPEAGTGLVLLQGEEVSGLEAAAHEPLREGPRKVRLVAERAGVRVERRIELDERGYGAWVRVKVDNRGPRPIEPGFELRWYGGERAPDAPDRFPSYSLVALAGGDVRRTPVSGLGRAGFFRSVFGGDVWPGELLAAPVEWVGLDSQYFMSVAMAENPMEAMAFVGPLGQDRGVASLRYPPFAVPPGREIERSYRIYLGPKVEEVAAAVSPRLADGLRTGWAWIRPLVVLFEHLLVWTHDHVVPNYGVAIILLTVLLRLLTYPLTQKSMSSMRRFSVIAPEMKALQDKYKGDRTRLQQEMMALYQRKGINPLAALGGGCLPMVVQFPFLIALYFALQGSIELRHAPFFGWIRDLSAPETLFWVAGVPVRLLPVLMGGAMVLQQRLTPATNVDPQQRQMMMWMSVMFVFLFYQFPSGLVLYWFVSNLLGIAQQVWVNRQPVAAGERAASRA